MNPLSNPLLYPPSFHALLAQLSAHHKSDNNASQDGSQTLAEALQECATSNNQPDTPRDTESFKQHQEETGDNDTEERKSSEDERNNGEISGEETKNEAEERKNGEAGGDERRTSEDGGVSEGGSRSPGRDSRSPGWPPRVHSGLRGLDPRATELPRPMDVKGLATLRAIEQYRTLDLDALEEYRRALEMRTLEARAAQINAQAQLEAAHLSGRSTPSPTPVPSTHTPPESPALNNEDSSATKRPEYNIDALLKKEA